jgi:hypothetical protein
MYALIILPAPESLLTFPQNGSFVLRFSESSPGCVAICYKVADVSKPVRNYLVKPEDIKGKTLPQFLRSRQELTHIIQFVALGNFFSLTRSLTLDRK